MSKFPVIQRSGFKVTTCGGRTTCRLSLSPHSKLSLRDAISLSVLLKRIELGGSPEISSFLASIAQNHFTFGTAAKS
jgi:hypothetical protein